MRLQTLTARELRAELYKLQKENLLLKQENLRLVRMAAYYQREAVRNEHNFQQLRK